MARKWYCKQLVLLILVFTLTGCLSGTVPKYHREPGEAKPGQILPPIDIIISSVEAPTIPPSLTDEVSMGALGHDDSQWGRSGAYKIIPQIATNYNDYIDRTINGLLTNMLAITPDDKELRINGYLTTVRYEDIKNHNVFERKITFVNDKTKEIEAVFYRNKNGNRLNLVIRYRGDERELREVIFEDLGTEKHAIVLYYRREAITPDNKIADMNGIVEVWETSGAKQVKDVRVYDLSKSEAQQHIVNFAAFSYKDLLFPTTARYFHNAQGDRSELTEIYESPAIFNERDKYVRSLKDDETMEGYPAIANATAVYYRGVDHKVVRDAVINIDTLESNLVDLVFGYRIRV